MILPQFWKLDLTAPNPYVILKSFVCNLYVICMSIVCPRMSLVCHSYVTRMSLVCTLCHPYVTRMFLYVIRMSLVCTRMSSVYHSYVLACHPYVTHMWFYHEPKYSIKFHSWWNFWVRITTSRRINEYKKSFLEKWNSRQ